MTTLLAQSFFSWPVEMGLIIVSFGLGLLFKRAFIAKQRKRILNLEDEMLSNHSKILSLEKKISETRSEKNGVKHDYDLSTTRLTDKERNLTDKERKIS